MLEEKLVEIVKRIQSYQCESKNIEIKAASGGCPRLYDSLSSFSNQDEGGIIILGLKEKDNFATVGVYDVQDLQHKVTAQCKQMEPEVRPLFTVAQIDGKSVLAIEVPGCDVAQRPVYYKGLGIQKGSYVRVGEADEPMNEYEVYSYEAFKRRIRDDVRVVEGARLEHLQPELLEKYLDAVKMERENLSHNTSNSQILDLMGVTAGGKPTISGVLVFGKYPQAYFPQLCITAVVVPGTEVGDIGSEGERFIANKRLTGTISEMLNAAVDFVQRNMRVKTIINEQGQRSDKAEFPIKAVREVILNALVHRDYSIHTEGSPITIYMFSNRMEVSNIGGLYGRISIDSLGKVHPETRNPTLANILELLKETENRFSGIPTIRREMKLALLPEPLFSVSNGEFKVTLDNGYSIQEKEEKSEPTGLDVRAAGVLKFCSEPRSREELIAFTGFSSFYTMSKIVQPLVKLGYLKMSLPDKPKSPNQRYCAL